MAKKQAVKKKAAERKKVPYRQIAEMAKTMSAVQIAQKLGRTNKGKDCSHSLRAILSRMRSVGWRDVDGKLRKLTVERVGQLKKKAVKKTGKKPTKKPATKPKTTAPTEPAGKTQAAGGE